MRVLVIEDYTPLRTALDRGIREAGYAVDTAKDGEEGLAFAEASPYDAIILDLMLPKIDGLTVLKTLRDRGTTCPVLIVTAKDQVPDRVLGLDVGADDYIVKPFAFDELLARLRALIRRSYRALDNVLHIADLEVDTMARTVSRSGDLIPLTAREYALLEYLAFRRGQIVTRAEIREHVYDFASEQSSNVIDVYVGYLRKKLEQGSAVKLIQTHRGLGYSLQERAE